jgi:hypothetical protein
VRFLDLSRITPGSRWPRCSALCTTVADAMRNNHRLSAKFYIILWVTPWLGAISCFLMGVCGGPRCSEECCTDVSRKEEEKSDFANTRSVVVGHFSMYTFNLKRFCVGWVGG